MRDPTVGAVAVPAARGRPFPKGNPGRKPGSRNRATVAAATLLQGEAEELTRKAIELALAGNTGLLKSLLNRVLPRERLVTLDLPRMEFADDAVEALGSVMRAVSEGTISPNEGAQVAMLIKSFREAIDTADVVKRLDALEAEMKGLQRGR